MELGLTSLKSIGYECFSIDIGSTNTLSERPGVPARKGTNTCQQPWSKPSGSDLWDKVAIAMYPSRAAMMDMMRSPKMQEIGVHRAAGLAGQLNIESVDAQGVWLGDAGV